MRARRRFRIRKADTGRLTTEVCDLLDAQRVSLTGSWTIELPSGRRYRSPEYLRLYGMSAAEAHDAELPYVRMDPGDRARVRAALDRLTEHGDELDESYRVVLPDGTGRVIRARGRRELDLATGMLRAVGTVQDVTEARGLQEQLTKLSAALDAVLQHSPTAIFLKDREQRFLLANEETARIMGRPGEDLVGRTLWDLLPADVADALEVNDADVAARNQTVSFEESAPHAGDGGRVHTWLASKFPVRDDVGNLIGVGGISLDVTARKEAELAQRAADERFRAVVEAAPDGFVIVDEGGSIVMVNTRAEEMFGFASAELIGNPVEMLLPRDVRDRHRGHLKAFLGEPHSRMMGAGMELIARRRDGSTFPVEVSLSPVHTESGVLVASAIRDVTARREAEHEIGRLAAIVDSSHEAIIGKTLEGRIASWNAAAEGIYGFTAAEAIGNPITILLTGPEQEQEVGSILKRVAAGEIVDQLETTRRTKSGRIIDMSLIVSPIRDSYGEIVGVSTIGRDVTDNRQAARALAAAQARFRAAFENAPIGVAIAGLRGSDRGRFIQTNAALARMIGWEPGELDGVAISTITHPDDDDRTADAYEQLDHDQTTQVEKRYIHRDGREIWVLISSTPIPAEDGSPAAHAVTQILDISERKQFEGQLRHLADHDALTGLYNRHRFEMELQRVVDENRRYNRRAALFVLDLDGFKLVNDRFGHSAGDELVSRIASLMRQSVRATDILARIGGDEFALILQECGEADAVNVAEKILEAIRRRGILVADDHTARVTTSIGITVFDASSDLTAAELVVEADIAMYEAKADGKDRYMIYDRAANRREVLATRHSWLERLRSAIDEDRFVLHAQPIVGICGNGIPRYELLLRLPDDNGDLIPPGAFLYKAERFNLMGEIDRWVLRRAVKLLHDHTAAGNDIALAVNLSGKTMNDLKLPGDLAAMLDEYPIPEGRLVVEVTETAAIVNIERARDLARELRKLGCRFALDDFGAGFASFYYLKHLDFDYLKIDGEFIKQLTSNATDKLVVKAVVDIAKGLHTHTVAEFVGDDDTVELLRQLGVSYGQGYHLGKPGPLGEQLPTLPIRSGSARAATLNFA